MTNTTLIQPSMSAGELSPEMYGRVDTEHYKIGLALARNFCVDYHGGVFNRPGTRHISVVEHPVRHIPFERSPQVTYMLEFGEKTMRILKKGKYIEDPASPGTPYTVATPYSSSELPDVRYIQSVDVMTLFHVDHQMFQVKHYAEDDWKVEEFKSKSGPYEKINIDESKSVWASGQKGTVSIYSSFDLFLPEHVGRLMRLETVGAEYTTSWVQRMSVDVGDYCYYAGNYYQCSKARSNSLTGDSPPIHTEGEKWDGPDKDLPSDNDDHYIGIKWRYSNSGFGEVEITKYISPTEVEAKVLKELPQDISHTGSIPSVEWEWKDQTYVHINPGTTSEVAGTFIIGPDPGTYEQDLFQVFIKRPTDSDYVQLPQKKSSRDVDVPDLSDWNWYVYQFLFVPMLTVAEQTDWTTAGGETADIKLVRIASPEKSARTHLWAFNSLSNGNGFPRCGAYYSERLCLGGNIKQSQSIWMSQTDSYDDFGTSTPTLAEDSLSINVAGVRLSEIDHLLPLNALLAFTSGGVWAVSPAESKRVLATDPPAIDVQSYNGSSFIAPLTTGSEALYLQKGRQIIREIQYDFNRSSFADANLCVRSSHIFKNRRVVSWAYAKDPYCLVWCVFDDGTAATLTYMKEQQVWGWTTHETNGKYLTVSSVEEDDRSAVYFSVLRNGKIHIEHQADRNSIDVVDSFFFDNGVTVDNRTEGNLIVSGGKDWNYPEEVDLLSSSNDFDTSMLGEVISIRDGDDVYMIKIFSVSDEKNATGRLEQAFPEHLRDVKISSWGVMFSDISGLDHLEGETVGALVDGMDGGQYQVSGGQITLGVPGLIAHVGLPYKSIGRTLPIEIQTKYTATSKDKVKSVSKVSLELYESYGGLAGTTIKNMYEIKQRLYEDYVSPVEPRTGLGEVDVSSSYNNDGQVYFMQDAPLPFNVLSVIPEVEIGG